jgi:stearoyl-CoA desaturase (delta-9 desaturase)
VKLDWVNIGFLGGYHVALIVALPIYLFSYVPSWELIGITLFLIAACLLSITMGYHRLYAHKTYRTRSAVEWVLLFFGTLATEGSALKWSHDHRLHHKHVDTDLDPYGTPKGFWHSHIIWMFKEPAPWHGQLVRDLERNGVVQLQHRFYGWWMALTNIFVVSLVGLVTGEWFGAFVFAFLVRLFVVHHSTWFINSLAHIWGSKPYSTEHSAVNNLILAFLTFGEGYHNYHHTFSSDYRNGVRWYQFDPPKYLLWLFSKIGLATDLKKVDHLTIKRNLISADRKLMLEHLETIRHLDREQIAHMIERVFEPLTTKLVGLKTATERYDKLKQAGSDEVAALRKRVLELSDSISNDMKEWQELCRFVLRLKSVGSLA